MRSKKWLFLSLALLCALALSMTMFSSGQKANQSAAGQKMPVNLKQLCAMYNDSGVQKLDQINQKKLDLAKAAAATPEKQGRLLQLQKMIGTDDVADANPVKQSSGTRGLGPISDPVLQKRWGNPSFDVARGVIITASDPRSLESAYLKIRKAWQKDNTWKAFCEFAIYKAEEIANKAGVRYLNLLPAPQLDNDLGSASTGASRLRVGTGGNWDTDKGFTGQGVIVGDVDSGVDWSHGDFLNPDGSTRILYLWDTSEDTAGKTPEDLFGMTGLNYGTVWTNEEIDGGLCTEYDPSSSEGHGTHTCGTAAGNGGATGNYTGMAPNADIIFVKGLDPSGVEFIFEMASRMGRPAVVNNSWGISWAQYGPYYGYVYLFPGDGSDEYSQYFNYLTTVYPKGAIIVKSAGNNGMFQTTTDAGGTYDFAMYKKSYHFGGTTSQAKPINHVYHRISHNFGYGKYREYSDMMIRSNVPVKVKVTMANGPVCVMNTGEYGSIPGADTISPQTYFDLDYGIDPYNGEYMGYMWFDYLGSNQAYHFPDGNWTLQVTPLNAGTKAKYDVWLYTRQTWYYNSAHTAFRSYYDSCFTKNASHDEYQLDWAASPDVITVGAWTTRSLWLGADGYMHNPWWDAGYNLTPKPNTITYFSSPGPTRDGRMKPDIAAPGACIISTMPYNLAAGIDPGNQDPDGQHQWMWGTSMAAPHGTGGIALLLQKYPGSGIDMVRHYLTNWATKDSFTRKIGKNGFGAGKLNLKKLKSLPVAVLTVDKNVLDLSNNDVATFNGSASYDPDKLPIHLKWILVSKPDGAVCTLTPGDGDTAVLVPDPHKIGTYKVGLIAEGDVYDSAKVVVSVQTVK